MALAMALAKGGQTMALWPIGSQTTACWPVALSAEAEVVVNAIEIMRIESKIWRMGKRCILLYIRSESIFTHDHGVTKYSGALYFKRDSANVRAYPDFDLFGSALKMVGPKSAGRDFYIFYGN